MATSKKNLVLIPVDESVHSERAFDGEYRSTLLYCHVGKAAWVYIVNNSYRDCEEDRSLSLRAIYYSLFLLCSLSIQEPEGKNNYSHN